MCAFFQLRPQTETDRQTDRARQRQTQTDRDRNRETKRVTETETQTQTNRQTDRTHLERLKKLRNLLAGPVCLSLCLSSVESIVSLRPILNRV